MDSSKIKLSKEEEELLELLGLGASLKREGEFLQVNEKPLICQKKGKDFELIPIKEAIKKYDGLKEYYWKLLDSQQNEYTKEVAKSLDNGYFIRIPKGVKLVYPIQACMYIHTKDFKQKVHNIVVVEEGAELNLITSCAVHPHISSAFHIGVSEFFVKKKGKLTFTMIHMWGEKTEVRPVTGILVEEEGVFISTYVSLKPVKYLKSNPVCRLIGNSAKASFISILANYPNCYVELGGDILLEAENTIGEVISRSVIYGGENIAKGKIIAKAPKVKGHIECEALMLTDKEGTMRAIPELDSYFSDVKLTHEAAVGKIAREEIEYLMSRGLTEEQATALIVKGFLNVKIEGISPELQKQIDNVLESVKLGHQ